jgi:hypothetical protein
MATQPRIAFRYVRSLTGLPVPMESWPEAASQTFKAGAPVYLDGNGRVTACGTDPALIMGIATKDGSNTTAGAVDQLVILAHPDVLFLGNMDTGAGGAGVTVITQRGKCYGITVHSGSGKWTVDYAKTTGTAVVVWNFWTGDGQAIGDTLGWVVFSFDHGHFQGMKTS